MRQEGQSDTLPPADEGLRPCLSQRDRGEARARRLRRTRPPVLRPWWLLLRSFKGESIEISAGRPAHGQFLFRNRLVRGDDARGSADQEHLHPL